MSSYGVSRAVQAPSKKSLPGKYVPNNPAHSRLQQDDLFPKHPRRDVTRHDVTEENSRVDLSEGGSARVRLESEDIDGLKEAGRCPREGRFQNQSEGRFQNQCAGRFQNQCEGRFQNQAAAGKKFEGVKKSKHILGNSMKADVGGSSTIGRNGLCPRIHLSSGDLKATAKTARNSAKPTKSSGNSAELTPNYLGYEVVWTVGINPDVRFLNLSTQQRDDICFVAQEILALYNLDSGEYRVRDGHTDHIVTLRRDRSGQHVLTLSETQLTVWDSYLATPILTLRPAQGSIFIDAQVSAAFVYIWCVSTNGVHVWNVPHLKCNNQDGFVYSLPKPVRGDTVELLADPLDDTSCILVSEYEVHCLSIENLGNINDQELIQYVPPFSRGHAGNFTCAAYQEGTGILFIGTQHGSILEWSRDNGRSASGKIQFAQDVKLSFTTRANKNDPCIAVTSILCTKRLVLVASSNGAITVLTSRLKLLYWIEKFGANLVTSMCLRRPERDRDRDGIVGDDSLQQTAIDDDICRRFGGIVIDQIVDSDGEESTLQNLDEPKPPCLQSSTSLHHHASPPSSNVQKLAFLKCCEPEFGSEPLRYPIGDILVQTVQGDLLCVEFHTGFYWTVLEHKPSNVQHACFHPERTIMYVLYDRCTVEVMDFGQCKRLEKRRVRTVCGHGEHNKETRTERQGLKAICKVLSDSKVEEKPVEHITAFECVVKFGITLLFVGLDNGEFCILDGDVLTTLHRHVGIGQSALRSSITSFLFNDANAMFVTVRQNGFITVFDMLELTELHEVLHYKAHDIISDVMLDGATLTQLKVVTIGNDRMCHVRYITKTLDLSNPTYECSVQIVRVEQFAKPLVVCTFPRDNFTADLLNPSLKPLNEDLYVIGNSEYKYRFHLKSTLQCIKTIQGAVLSCPLENFRLLPSLDAVAIFTAAEIVVQELPLTQFRHSYIHLSKLAGRVCYVNKETEYIVSFGGNRSDNDRRKIRLSKDRGADNRQATDLVEHREEQRVQNHPGSISVWKIAPADIKSPDRHVEFAHPLLPYYELIPGGYHGEEFARIRDAFVYFTIQGACHSYISRESCILNSKNLSILNRISPCDLPFIVSALGFYPSEFDLDLMQAEIELMALAEVDFKHFLLLYLNHRPLRSASYEEVFKALEYFASDGQCTEILDSELLPKSALAAVMTRLGEVKLTEDFVAKCLESLYEGRDEMKTSELASRLVEPLLVEPNTD